MYPFEIERAREKEREHRGEGRGQGRGETGPPPQTGILMWGSGP